MDKSELEKMIKKLPRWARVAFAARCARRVQHWYLNWYLNLPGATPESIDAVEAAIQSAERIAAIGDDMIKDFVTSAASAARAVNAARDADAAARDAYDSARAARAARASDAAYAAAYAAYAAAYAAYAAHTACAAANAYAVDVKADFELLLKLSRENGWDDQTPVPSDVFGPLWPEGKTPSDTEKSGQTALDKPLENLQVELTIPKDLDANEVSGAVLKLYQAMNAHHIALGGTGLKLEEFLRMVGANVEVEA